jgi:hypothetical protein
MRLLMQFVVFRLFSNSSKSPSRWSLRVSSRPSWRRARRLPTVALSGEAFDLFVKELLGQQSGHLCVVLNQAKFRVDQAIEYLSQHLRTADLSG